MLKKSPSRNQRTKGIRVKHILQIAVLFGVCFWLIYQLKHSHDKKVALAEKDAKTSIRTQTVDELLKLGRKDLPHKEIPTNVKQEDDEEEEVVGEEEDKQEVVEREEEDQKHEAGERQEENPKHEVEGREEEEEEEDQKHQVGEQEDDNKNEETEDEGKGAEDDEIDENEQEVKEGGTDREEDILDEEKETEAADDAKDGDRIENEEKYDQDAIDKSSDDQDNDGVDENAHEAREEHYKGDDASSAVTHDTQIISTETDRASLESSNDTSETSLEKEIKSNDTEDIHGNQNNSRSVDGGTAENDTLSTAANEKKLEENLSNPATSLLFNTTGEFKFSDLPGANNITTLLNAEASNDLHEVSNATGSYHLNGTDGSELVHSQNLTEDVIPTREGITGQPLIVEQTNDTVSNNEVDTNVSDSILRSDGTTEAEETSRSLTVEDTTDATKIEESYDTSESGTNGMEDAVQHDPIDSSDSHISEYEKEARTDLDTLPEIETQGDENEEAAAE